MLADQWEAVQEQGFLTRAFNWEENLNYCLVGIRRAGKSYLLIQRIHELLKEGVPEDHILYVNFEDERLLEMTAEERAQYAAGHCEVCSHCRGPVPDALGLKYCPHCGFEVSTKQTRQAFWGKFFYCLFVAILMIALFVMM